MIAIIVYCLCALTSGICALVLLRGYRLRRTSLLFWSGLAFSAFGVSNVLLFVDLVVLPEIDLSMVRNLTTLAGIILLLRGLIWETS